MRLEACFPTTWQLRNPAAASAQMIQGLLVFIWLRVDCFLQSMLHSALLPHAKQLNQNMQSSQAPRMGTTIVSKTY